MYPKRFICAFTVILIFSLQLILCAQEKFEGQVRGIWVSPSVFGTEEKPAVEKIKSTLDEYQKCGITVLIVPVKSGIGALYKSTIVPFDPAYKWDFFGTFLTEARKRNMTVHAWFSVFSEGDLTGEVRKHPEWLVTSRKGEMVRTLNPALPAVREYVLSYIIEVVKLYGIDWVHLDYVRYPCDPSENYYSYDVATRELFKKYSGEDPLLIKHQDSGNSVWNEWIEWNADQVTQFVRELRSGVKQINKNGKISAAVFPVADNAKVLIGQDWKKWAEDGLVDMLCPMLYTNHMELLESYTKRAVEIGKGHCSICIGLGVISAHNENTPEGLLKQMEICKDSGADGVIYFAGAYLNQKYFDVLESAR